MKILRCASYLMSNKYEFRLFKRQDRDLSLKSGQTGLIILKVLLEGRP